MQRFDSWINQSQWNQIISCKILPSTDDCFLNFGPCLKGKPGFLRLIIRGMIPALLF